MFWMKAGDKRSGETVVEYIARLKSEADDTLRVCEALQGVIPIFGSLPEVGDWEQWVESLAVCNYEEATKLFKDLMRPWADTEEYRRAMNEWRRWSYCLSR